MMRDGFVEESGISDDERRRYYRLTGLAKRHWRPSSAGSKRLCPQPARLA